MAAAMGPQAKLGLGAANPVTEAFEFLRDTVELEEVIIDASGIRGTRSVPKERSRSSQRMVKGQLVMNPTPVELANILPRILGAAAAGTTFALAETLPSFYMTSDRVTKVHTFSGCVVNKATFKGAVGAPLELTLDIMGVDETLGNPGTFPSLTLDITSPPYILPDLALTIGGPAFTCDQFTLEIDNKLEVRFGNSLTPTAINPTGREITLDTRVPFADAGSLYGTGSSGLAVNATFTNGGVSCLFAMAAVLFPKLSPVVDGRGEIWLPIKGPARKSGSTNELIVTNDSTP